MKKLRVLALAIASLALVVSGCGSNDKAPEKTAQAGKEISIGVTAGPHAEVMEVVKQEAEKQGLKIKIVEFNDFVQPNVALDQKELNMNSFQHQPYLDKFVKDRNLKLVSIGKSILLPMGLYSNKYRNLNALPDGATVAIPNDPTNGGRGLLLLQQAGLLKLKDGVGPAAQVTDIVSNPKNLKIKELEAAQIPRSLNDVDVATVNTNYALNAGLNPLKDAVVIESKDSPYANVIAVREADKDNENYKKLVSIYQSEPVKKFIADHFKGSIVPAF